MFYYYSIIFSIIFYSNVGQVISRRPQRQVDYDKIYDVDLQPPFPVQSNTLVNLTITLLEHRSFYPGEAFFLNYNNEYVFRYEPLAQIAHNLAEYLHFKPKRYFYEQKVIYFEIEFVSIDHTMNLEIAVQRRDINYPSVTPIYAIQMNVYPNSDQMIMETNVTDRDIPINTTFKVNCEWKDYTAKIAFENPYFQVLKLENLDVVLRFVLLAHKSGGYQIITCRSIIDANNDIVIEKYLLFNVTVPQISEENNLNHYKNTIIALVEWLKLASALFLMIIVSIVVSYEALRHCYVDGDVYSYSKHY